MILLDYTLCKFYNFIKCAKYNEESLTSIFLKYTISLSKWSVSSINVNCSIFSCFPHFQRFSCNFTSRIGASAAAVFKRCLYHFLYKVHPSFSTHIFQELKYRMTVANGFDTRQDSRNTTHIRTSWCQPNLNIKVRNVSTRCFAQTDIKMFQILVCMFNVDYKPYVEKIMLKRTDIQKQKMHFSFHKSLFPMCWHSYIPIFVENRISHAPSFSKLGWVPFPTHRIILKLHYYSISSWLGINFYFRLISYPFTMVEPPWYLICCKHRMYNQIMHIQIIHVWAKHRPQHQKKHFFLLKSIRNAYHPLQYLSTFWPCFIPS